MKLLWLIGASSAQLLSVQSVNTTTTVQSEDSEHNNNPQSKKKKVFDYGRRVQWYKNHCIGKFNTFSLFFTNLTTQFLLSILIEQ